MLDIESNRRPTSVRASCRPLQRSRLRRYRNGMTKRGTGVLRILLINKGRSRWPVQAGGDIDAIISHAALQTYVADRTGLDGCPVTHGMQEPGGTCRARRAYTGSVRGGCRAVSLGSARQTG